MNSILNILPLPNGMLVSSWGFGILFKLFLGPALLWLVRCNCHVWGPSFVGPFFYRSIGRLVYSGWDPCQISGYLSLFSANCAMIPSRGEVGPILLLSFQFLTVLAFLGLITNCKCNSRAIFRATRKDLIFLCFAGIFSFIGKFSTWFISSNL